MHEPYAYKQVIVVRRDLNMRKGKMASQVAHAVLNSFLGPGTRTPSALELKYSEIEWLKSGGAKIVVGCSSEVELFEIVKSAKSLGLKTALILDQGRTEFFEPTYTCCAIGPDLSIEVDKITGHLSLL